MKFLANLNPFRSPSAKELAARELADAECQLLLAERQQAYSQKLAEFYRERIKNLRGAEQ